MVDGNWIRGRRARVLGERAEGCTLPHPKWPDGDFAYLKETFRQLVVTWRAHDVIEMWGNGKPRVVWKTGGADHAHPVVSLHWYEWHQEDDEGKAAKRWRQRAFGLGYVLGSEIDGVWQPGCVLELYGFRVREDSMLRVEYDEEGEIIRRQVIEGIECDSRYWIADAKVRWVAVRDVVGRKRVGRDKSLLLANGRRAVKEAKKRAKDAKAQEPLCEALGEPDGRGLFAFDEWKTYAEWEKESPVSASTIHRRVKAGWNAEDAISASAGKAGRPEGAATKQRVDSVVEAFGERKSLDDWLLDERCKAGSVAMIKRRLRAGMSPEDAISQQPQHRGRKDRPVEA